MYFERFLQNRKDVKAILCVFLCVWKGVKITALSMWINPEQLGEKNYGPTLSKLAGREAGREEGVDNKFLVYLNVYFDM